MWVLFRVSRAPARAQGGWRPRPPMEGGQHILTLWPLAADDLGLGDANRDDSGRYHSPSAALITDTSQAASSLPRNQPHINSIVKLDSSPAYCFFLPERAAFHNIISSRPHPQVAFCCSSRCRWIWIWIARKHPARCTVDDRTTRLAPAPARVNDPTLLLRCHPPMIARAAVDDSALLSDAPWSSSQHASTGRCKTADTPTTTLHRNSQPNRDEEPSFLPARLKTRSL